MRTRLLVLALVAGGCGGDLPPANSAPYTGTFAVMGAPHEGQYTECSVSLTGSLASVTCDGLVSGCAVGDCAAVISFGMAAGDYQCPLGAGAVSIFDPSLPDNGAGAHPADAGCASSMQATGQPLPDCPKDANGCNRALGDCTISVSALTPSSGSAPYGHFSGSITATLWTSSKTMNDCDANMDPQLYPDGQRLDLTFTGGW